MPVAPTNPRRTVLVSLAAVVLGLGLLAVVLVANGATSGTDGGSFDTLQIETLLRFQERDGVPTCFDDPVSGNRPICVFHTGEDPDDGWLAYDAQVDGCGFETLSPESTELVDTCTGEAYPFTGEGLPQYDATVQDGRLVIALTDDDNDNDNDNDSSSVGPGRDATRIHR